MPFHLNTTTLHHPYSSLIPLTLTNSSLPSRMRKANALPAISLHPPILLHLPPPLLLHHSLVTSVVALAILTPIALRSRGHLLMPSRSANRGGNQASPSPNNTMPKKPLRMNPSKRPLQQLNLQAMQVLSQLLSGPNGCNLEHVLIGTQIQVPLHI